MSEVGFAGAGPVAQGFTLGRTIGLTTDVLRRNLVAVGAVSLVVNLLSTALTFGAGFLIGAVVAPGSGQTFLAGVIGGLVGLVINAVGTGAITRIAVGDLDGRRVGAGAAFATGLRLAVPLVALSIVATLGIGVASLLLAVPGIMLAMRWFVAVPVRVVEPTGLGGALARSGELTAGYRWRLFGLLLALVLLSLILQGGVFWLQFAQGVDTATGLGVLAVVRIIASTITTAISATVYAVCYTELRSVKEGATPSQLAAVFA